jgi:hypothetical protein
MVRQKQNPMNSKRTLAVVLSSLWMALVPPSAFSTEIYSNSFTSGTSFPEWSDNVFSVTPVGLRRFLGEFDDRTVTLTLTGLPAHARIRLSFDFLALKTWGGIGPSAPNNTGPDRFVLSFANGPMLLDTTFSNGGSNYPYNRQNYPAASDSGIDYPAFTGASEHGTLGYSAYGIAGLDSVYSLSFTLPHTSPTVTFQFRTFNIDQGIEADESWGLDNVVVSVLPELPRISVTVTTASAHLSFLNLVTNQEYRIMTSATLASWVEVHRFTATAPMSSWSEALSPGGRQFYRLEWNE